MAEDVPPGVIKRHRIVPLRSRGEDALDAPSPVEAQRRVYSLPTDLVDRIVEFQKEKGYSSEVEAVRRLLDDALKSRDTLEKLISRFMVRLGALRISSEVAKDVLVGHPLVRSMSFEDDQVEFSMRDGWVVTINDQGKVIVKNGNGTALDLYVWEPLGDKFGPGRIKDDEIPF